MKTLADIGLVLVIVSCVFGVTYALMEYFEVRKKTSEKCQSLTMRLGLWLIGNRMTPAHTITKAMLDEAIKQLNSATNDRDEWKKTAEALCTVIRGIEKESDEYMKQRDEAIKERDLEKESADYWCNQHELKCDEVFALKAKLTKARIVKPKPPKLSGKKPTTKKRKAK